MSHIGWTLADRKSYMYWFSLQDFASSYVQVHCDIRVYWSLQNHVVYLTFWLVGGCLTILGLNAVRSGAFTNPHWGAAYSLLLSFTFVMTVQFVFNRCAVAAKQYIVCLQAYVFCTVQDTRRLSETIVYAGLLIFEKMIAFYPTVYILSM